MPTCSALPELVNLSDFNGDFKKYQDHLYHNIFKTEIYNGKIFYNGKCIMLKRYPEYLEKEESFFHLTSKFYNHNEEDREPDLRRCERLGWIKPAIEVNHLDICNNPCFEMYKKIVSGKERVILLNVEERYNIILEERKEYCILVTAYYIEHDNRLRRDIRALKSYKQQETP